MSDAATLVAAVLRLIESDPHQWSERPCQTCTAISAIAGRQFGCSARRRPAPTSIPSSGVLRQDGTKL